MSVAKEQEAAVRLRELVRECPRRLWAVNLIQASDVLGRHGRGELVHIRPVGAHHVQCIEKEKNASLAGRGVAYTPAQRHYWSVKTELP